MSLLLDALKKAGQTQPGTASQDAKPELTLQEVARPEKQASHTVEDNLARVAGQKLFDAKVAPAASGRRLNVVALVVGGGLLLAAGGAYYVWREITPAEPIYSTVTARPAQPVQAFSPATTAADVNVARSDASARAVIATPRSTAPKRRTASRNEQGIVIEHGQTQAAGTATAAYQAYLKGDFATAWQIYRGVLQQDAKNRDALLGLAAIAQQQGQDTVAAEYYGRVLTLDPRDPEAYAGMSALIPGDAAGKESRLKLLLAHRPDAATLHFALGNLYAEQSRWAEAQQAYFNSVNREPDSAYYAFNLAVSLDHMGQGKLAAQYYQRALQLDKTGSTGFDRAQTQRRADELTPP